MRTKTILVAVALAVGSCPLPARADIAPEQVRASIDRAIAYLERQQNADGSWPDQPAYTGGTSALVTLALLNAGVPPESDSMQRALGYLRGLSTTQTYVVALQTMVFCAGEPKKDLLRIRQNAAWFENTQVKSGERRGAWSYPSGPAGGGGDPSNSQFALLALYEAERVGIKVREQTWRLALQYWQRLQLPDGSWRYSVAQTSSGSMTCAGIASMIIASGELSAGDARVVDGVVQCCGEQSVNDSVDRGLAWLDRNFSVHTNPSGAGRGATQGSWLLYYLYGLERAGRMTARRFIGQHDWYREGADMLVRNQDNLSGYWKGTGPHETNPLIGTSFSLLFLAKGRRPVLVAKVKHGPGDDWNHHRSDLANLTSYVERQWERDLTWQVLDAQAASVEDMLQSPVLFISGKDAPVFSDEQKKRLRDYIDRGGFIFAEACCGGAFEDGFRALMDDVFPEPEYQLRLLPPEHPVWRAEQPVDARYVRPLWGIDIGCRTSVVFCPADLSCYWELARPGREDRLPARVREEIEACRAIGINVLAYATNRELKYKFDFFTTADADAPKDDFERGKLYAARLLHPGGCNAAPGALANLLQTAGEKLQLRVDTQPRELAITDPKLFHYHLVFMHGRHDFRLTPAERKQLRAYLERGGMLFADAICSSREFSEAFTREMAAVFPEQPLARIPAKDPLFTTTYGGDDLSLVGRREPQRGAADGPLRSQVSQVEPYLEAIKLGDRYAVIFSPYDLSCALENHESLECAGYTRKDAARIGLSVLLYSLYQ
ncbi:MAG: DUF4159 domain-containing protein [Pirellulales bacterium]